MSKTDSVLSVYSDARSEYTKQLCIYLVPAYFQFFLSLLDKAKELSVQEPKRILWHFQNLLNEIHDWNMEKVNNEINQINNNSGCDYLEDLLTAVFIAHTKVLTAIRLSSNKKKVQITVPKVEHFLFKALCESSKLLWSSSYLFREGIPSVEKQQNYRTIEQLLTEGVNQAIRNLVPVKSILKDFMNTDSDSDSDSDDDNEKEDKEGKEGKSSEKDEEKNGNERCGIERNDTEGGHNNVKLEENKEDSAPINSNDVQSIALNTQSNNESMIINKLENINIEEQSTINKLEDNTGNDTARNDNTNSEIIDSSSVIYSGELNSNSESNQNNMQTDIVTHPTIIIDEEEKPGVHFSDYNSVFQSGNPDGSDMIESIDNSEQTDTPDIEVLDEIGQPLDNNDFESLDEQDNDTEVKPSEYEVLT